jgi:hypothetical protein
VDVGVVVKDSLVPSTLLDAETPSLAVDVSFAKLAFRISVEQFQLLVISKE